MQKIYPFLICVGLFSACNANETTREEINTAPSIIRETENKVPETDSVEVTSETISSNELILPGKSIGLIKLNEDADVVYKLLGKPDKSDAAMGKVLATWFTEPKLSELNREKLQTNIFFVRNMGGAEEKSRAKQIRVTSPAYKLENNIRIGSDLKTIQAHFPNLQKAAIYTTQETKKQITIFHDKAAGIAFEMDPNNKCVGIGIQEPGKANFEVYTAVALDLKRI